MVQRELLLVSLLRSGIPTGYEARVADEDIKPSAAVCSIYVPISAARRFTSRCCMRSPQKKSIRADGFSFSMAAFAASQCSAVLPQANTRQPPAVSKRARASPIPDVARL